MITSNVVSSTVGPTVVSPPGCGVLGACVTGSGLEQLLHSGVVRERRENCLWDLYDVDLLQRKRNTIRLYEELYLNYYCIYICFINVILVRFACQKKIVFTMLYFQLNVN